MPFSEVLNHTFEAYGRNFKLISFFSLPFAIVFILSIFLPNFVSLSAIFLRYGSIQADLGFWDALAIVSVFLISLALFSFALVLVNLAVKSQRTLKRVTHYEHEKIENNVAKLFTIFLAVFVLTLLVNLLLYDYQLNSSLGLLFSLLITLAIIYVPQAIVVDDLGLTNAVYMSIGVIFRRYSYFLALIAIACGLILLNTQLFLELSRIVPPARYVAVLVNALVILPFLEVLKVEIYLSKYTVLHSA